MATVEGTVPIKEPVKHNEKLIITASSLGTVFEWYDFWAPRTMRFRTCVDRLRGIRQALVPVSFHSVV